jgi:hypothetical protein
MPAVGGFNSRMMIQVRKSLRLGRWVYPRSYLTF